MIYNFKRALGIGLVLYIATFATGIICGMVSGTDMSSMNSVPNSFWYVGMVAALVLTTLFTMWYFKNRNIVASAASGLLFGLTAAVLSFILDFILFSLGNQSGANVDLGAYYGDYRFWIVVALVLVSAKVVGWKLGRRNQLN
jgi:hypothetical protein